MKANLFLFCLMLLVSQHTEAQGFISETDLPVNGYSKKISGLDYDYHSCIPGLRESILIRATGGKDYMEWETDPVPEVKTGMTAAIIWVTALGSSPGNARMDLTTDQNHHFTFYTDGKTSWTIPATDGSSLSFNSIMTDQYGDHHGYMILRIPGSKIVAGKPLRITVTGGAANLTSWYMTYKKQVRTGVTLNSFPAILKGNKEPLQYVEAAIFYFGRPTEAKIYAGNKIVAATTLNFGYNSVSLGLPVVTRPTKVSLKVVSETFSLANIVTLFPVKKWKIDFIQHTHTDIGYTRSQTEILAEHLRYIDYALDYCDATDNYPENAKFRWTCEASWPVDEYLKTRPPEQVARLLKRIKEGRIEVTGMYFNFDEIPDEQILAASLQAAGRIRDKGIPVKVAMQDDVNGIGWCLNDYFNTMGIKYLNMGTHGHRALICFDKPTMFWWESPSGKRILTFRAEHYMTGNTVFEMQTGDMVKFRNNLLNYLIGLDGRQYPYDEIAIQHSGYLTDNSPPSTIASDLIKQWNDIFEWPELSTSSVESFFTDLEKNHSAEFPVIRGAWPDWWTDGYGASARETATTRKAAATLLGNTGGLVMAAVAGAAIADETRKKIDLVNEALLFYTEHTLGYSESVREPLSLQTMEQRALKDSYAWEANRRVASLGEDVFGLLQNDFKCEKDPTLLVFNNLNWVRSGAVTVYIDHQIVPRGMTAGIYDRTGNRYPAQAISSRSDGTYWMIWINNIPAFGYRKLFVRPVKEELPVSGSQFPGFIENSWYKIVLDKSRAAISSLFDKELSLELADHSSTYEIGEFILEQLGNRSQMEQKKLDSYKRTPLDTIWFDSVTRGPIYTSARFYGESVTAEKPRGFTIEFRLYNIDKLVEIVCSITKKSIIDPESFYIAFPFSLKDGKHFTEVQGGVIEAGVDQIRGSSNDWYTVQNFTAVRNQNVQLVLGCSEMPLMQLGAINTGRYQAGALPQSTNIFSWPMNNYWVTNFNADQRGGHTWTYYFTSSADNSAMFPTKFGWSNRVPLLARILPGNGQGDNKSEGSYLQGWPSNILLISAIPHGNEGEVILHIREIEGKETSLDLTNGITENHLITVESDVTGRALKTSGSSIKPYESKFFLLRDINK